VAINPRWRYLANFFVGWLVKCLIWHNLIRIKKIQVDTTCKGSIKKHKQHCYARQRNSLAEILSKFTSKAAPRMGQRRVSNQMQLADCRETASGVKNAVALSNSYQANFQV